jgi:hypothetical protein
MRYKRCLWLQISLVDNVHCRGTRKDVAMEGLYSSLYGDWPRISPYCVMVVSGLGWWGGGGGGMGRGII